MENMTETILDYDNDVTDFGSPHESLHERKARIEREIENDFVSN